MTEAEEKLVRKALSRLDSAMRESFNAKTNNDLSFLRAEILQAKLLLKEAIGE